MTDQNIKAFISMEVLSQISDKSVQNTVRQIFFDENNSVDWSKALTVTKENMPELQ